LKLKTDPAVQELTKALDQQIRDKLNKKQKEITEKRSVPDIIGSMGYPPIKNIERQEMKEYNLNLYKQHHVAWDKQQKDKREAQTKEKMEGVEIRKRYESEAEQEKQKKPAANKDYSHVWELQSRIYGITKNPDLEQENPDSLFLTSVTPQISNGTNERLSLWRKTLENTKQQL